MMPLRGSPRRGAVAAGGALATAVAAAWLLPTAGAVEARRSSRLLPSSSRLPEGGPPPPEEEEAASAAAAAASASAPSAPPAARPASSKRATRSNQEKALAREPLPPPSRLVLEAVNGSAGARAGARGARGGDHGGTAFGSLLRLGRAQGSQVSRLDSREDSWGFLVSSAVDLFDGVQEQLFVKVTTRNEGAVVQVEMAKPNLIISVYLILYAPVAMLWAAYYHYGERQEHYLVVLPLTMCSLIIGFDLINQSLSMLMKSPMVISAVQAGGCVVLCGAYALLKAGRVAAEVKESDGGGKGEEAALDTSIAWAFLARWSFVAAFFGIYQIFNHGVSMWCSLSERTIFTNLCPVVTLVFEATVMSGRLRTTPSFQCRMALSVMVLGAILFALQYPDFSQEGVFVASMMICVLVPYRLLQRSYLGGQILPVPVSVLGAFDGFFLLLPALLISAVDKQDRWDEWSMWMSEPSVVVMLFLSIIAFTANHICGLLMLQCSSATNFLIYHNIASFVVVGLGIMVFGDRVTSPLVCVGILVNLSGGLWYGVEAASQRKQPQPSDEAAVKTRPPGKKGAA